MLIKTDVHKNVSARPTRTGPVSRSSATPSTPSVANTSRTKGMSTYETTPMAIDRPNHWEKLATKPR